MKHALVLKKPKDFLYCVSFFMLFLGYSFFSSNNLVLVVMAAIILIIYFFKFKKSSIKIKPDEYVLFGCAVFLLFLLLIGQGFWIKNTHSIVLVIPFFTLFILKAANQEILKNTLFSATIIIVSIALYEKISGNYFFTSVAVINNNEIFLDEKLFSGATKMLRAKSIFLGPLTLAAFTIFSSIILRKNKYALFFCMLGAILSTSRTAIFITFAVFLATTYSSNINRKKLIFLFTLTPVSMLFLILFFGDTPFVERLFQVFDFSQASTSNGVRLYYWVSGLKEISEYQLDKFVFGNNGYFKEKYFNNAESGWITIFLDFGLIGFVLYVMPIFYMIKTKLNTDTRLMLVLLFLANSVFTFSYGVVGCFGYWLTLYILNKEKNEK